MTVSRPTGSSGRHAGSGGGDESGEGRPGVLVGLGVLATLLVAGGWLLPLWQARLFAPQYPGGLTTTAYGNRVAGDINEVNALNHYVGLGVFDPANVPEMKLWPLALAGALMAVVVALLLRRRPWPRRLALGYLWGVPIGVLAAIQFRLYQFGHDVTPGAAFRLDPFTPWVVGKTTVWNFETWAWPGLGLLAILAATAVVTFGPRLLDRPRRGGTPRAAGAVALVALLALSGTATLAPPALAQDHDHGAHEGGGAADAGEDAAPTPDIGPTSHGSMPAITEHPAAGDLASLLEATEPGGHLALPPGTYRGPVVIDRPVTIEGDGLPIVQGDGTGSVITVRAPGTVIRGLVVRGSGDGPTDNPAGIRIEADDVTVEGVVVEDSYMGIAVDSAAAVKLIDNHLHGRAGARIVDEGHAVTDDAGDDPDQTDHTDHAHHTDEEHAAAMAAASRSRNPSRGDAIWLHDVDHVLVRGNHIEHARDGVYVSFGAGALIDGNHVHSSRYAVHTMFARELSVVQNHFSNNLSGMVLMYGEGALLLRNQVEQSTSASTGFGIILKDIVAVEMVQNVLVDNRIGVHLDGPTETTVTANTVARHDVGVQAHSSVRATFSGNSFADNAIQVLPLGGHFRDVAWAADGWGNYWSTYRGYDARGEGRGAVPHTEGGSVDRLLARNPELLAIADSPAMRLLRSVEERWGRRSPALTDERPLTQPVSPALSVSAPDPAAGRIAVAFGLALTLPALVLFIRRPHRVTAASRRSLRAVHI
jgi:nitrous oxidase accessory protein